VVADESAILQPNSDPAPFCAIDTKDAAQSPLASLRRRTLLPVRSNRSG
jgi:hypothetical protein